MQIYIVRVEDEGKYGEGINLKCIGMFLFKEDNFTGKGIKGSMVRVKNKVMNNEVHGYR